MNVTKEKSCILLLSVHIRAQLSKPKEKMRRQTEKEPRAVGAIRLRTWVGVMFNGKDDRSNIKGNKRSGSSHYSQWNLLWHPPLANTEYKYT